MLNRRLIRIKVLQSLYAFDRMKEANYNWVYDRLRGRFSPDPDSMQTEDTPELKQDREAALKAFERRLQNDEVESDNSNGANPDTVKDAVLEFAEEFRRHNEKDQKQTRRYLLEDPENIYRAYLELLLFVYYLGNEAARDKGSLSKQAGVVHSEGNRFKLKDNRILRKLADNEGVQEALRRRKINWDGYSDLIRRFYVEVLKKDEEYIRYTELESAGSEEDRNIIDHIFRNLIFRNGELEQEMEQQYIRWPENKKIIRSLLKKTVKLVHESDDPEHNILAPLSYNYDDDYRFMEKLFDKCREAEDKMELKVRNKLQNWKIERCTLMDRIILKTALSEMAYFPGIPVKVSINEFIDISKNYSTPKSKQFVNGILDALSSELQEEGVIKKSGRGLIDNQ